MRADRLVSMVLLLQARGRTTAADLAAELGVSVRTVCFGTPEWPDGQLVPQASIEFEVENADAVAPAGGSFGARALSSWTRPAQRRGHRR